MRACNLNIDLSCMNFLISLCKNKTVLNEIPAVWMACHLLWLCGIVPLFDICPQQSKINIDFFISKMPEREVVTGQSESPGRRFVSSGVTMVKTKTLNPCYCCGLSFQDGTKALAVVGMMLSLINVAQITLSLLHTFGEVIDSKGNDKGIKGDWLQQRH